MWIRAVFFLWATVIPLAAYAQLPSSRFSPINYFGRYHGIGYSDGYHECKSGDCKREPNNKSFLQPISTFYSTPTAPPGPVVRPFAHGHRSVVPGRIENLPANNTPMGMEAVPLPSPNAQHDPGSSVAPYAANSPLESLAPGSPSGIQLVPDSPSVPYPNLSPPPSVPNAPPRLSEPSPIQGDRSSAQPKPAPDPYPSIPSLYEQVPPAPKRSKTKEESSELPLPKNDNAYLPAQRPTAKGSYSLIQSPMFRR